MKHLPSLLLATMTVFTCLWTISSHGETKKEIDELFEKYNTDGDTNHLSQAEYRAFIVDKTMKRFDIDKDGTIGRQDVDADALKQTTEFFRKADPSTPLSKDDYRRLTEKKEDRDDLLADVSNYVHLRRSFFSVDKSGKPATFSWTQAQTESSYSVDGAISLEPSLLEILHFHPHMSLGSDWSMDVEPEPTIEAHVSSDKKAAADSISGRLPLRFLAAPNDPTGHFVKNYQLLLSGVFETDSSWDTKTIQVEPLLTMTSEKLAMGIGQRLAPTNVANIAFRWRPYVGAEIGRVLDAGNDSSLQSGHSFTRFVARVHGELWFGERFLVAADFVHRTVFDGDDTNYDYGEISPILYFDNDKHFSVGMTFKSGKDAPDFNFVRSLNLWVGLKF